MLTHEGACHEVAPATNASRRHRVMVWGGIAERVRSRVPGKLGMFHVERGARGGGSEGLPARTRPRWRPACSRADVVATTDSATDDNGVGGISEPVRSRAQETPGCFTWNEGRVAEIEGAPARTGPRRRPVRSRTRALATSSPSDARFPTPLGEGAGMDSPSAVGLRVFEGMFPEERGGAAGDRRGPPGAG